MLHRQSEVLSEVSYTSLRNSLTMYKLCALFALVAMVAAAPKPSHLVLSEPAIVAPGASSYSTYTSVVNHGVPVVHSAPLAYSAPLVHSAPLVYSAPVVHSAPVVYSAPAVPVAYSAYATPYLI